MIKVLTTAMVIIIALAVYYFTAKSCEKDILTIQIKPKKIHSPFELEYNELTKWGSDIRVDDKLLLDNIAIIRSLIDGSLSYKINIKKNDEVQCKFRLLNTASIASRLPTKEDYVHLRKSLLKLRSTYATTLPRMYSVTCNEPQSVSSDFEHNIVSGVQIAFGNLNIFSVPSDKTNIQERKFGIMIAKKIVGIFGAIHNSVNEIFETDKRYLKLKENFK